MLKNNKIRAFGASWSRYGNSHAFVGGKITLYAFIYEMYARSLLYSVQVGRCTS